MREFISIVQDDYMVDLITKQIIKKPKKPEKNIEPVTCDTVLQLRLAGKYDEAKEVLIQQYKFKARLKRDFNNQLLKVERNVKRVLKICTVLNCNKKASDFVKCTYHRLQNKGYKINRIIEIEAMIKSIENSVKIK